jgi:hypothetical protein
MPSPEPSRRSDLSAVPSFLREGDRARRGAKTEAPASVGPAAPTPRALPRPVTPTKPPIEPEPRLDPASLPMPSLSRRRVVTAGGLLLAGLLTLSFVRQVGEATDAANRADELRAANAELRDEVARLQQDLGHVQDLHFIQLEGRAFGLGGKGEVPFALAAGAPELTADAPGSASVRLGAPPRPHSNLDAWLEVLFGPSH